MDWKVLLAALRERGWTQQLIAARVGCSQAAISDLSVGKTRDPAHSVGKALEALHESDERPPQTEPAKAA